MTMGMRPTTRAPAASQDAVRVPATYASVATQMMARLHRVAATGSFSTGQKKAR